MAYLIKTNKRKDGSTTYQIVEQNRIPGEKTRQKTRCVEKMNSAELAASGVPDAASYARERLAWWMEKKEERLGGQADVRLPLGGSSGRRMARHAISGMRSTAVSTMMFLPLTGW